MIIFGAKVAVKVTARVRLGDLVVGSVVGAVPATIILGALLPDPVPAILGVILPDPVPAILGGDPARPCTALSIHSRYIRRGSMGNPCHQSQHMGAQSKPVIITSGWGRG